jgi:hypothetical protein
MRRLSPIIAAVLASATLALLAGCPKGPAPEAVTKGPGTATPQAGKAPGAEATKAPGAEPAKGADVPKSGTPDAKAEEIGSKDAKVFIRAFYPGNEKHQLIKKMVFAYAEKYPGKVRARFIPFDSTEGYDEWHEAGLTCGGIVVNDEQTFSVKQKSGKSEDVTLKQFVGGEWTQEDLDAIIAAQVKLAYP